MSIGDIIVILGVSIAVIAAMYVLISGRKKGKTCCNCGSSCDCCNQSLLKLMESKDQKD